MTTIESRRRLIVVILLCLAVTGAAIRLVADRASLTYDIGTLLLVMWVPAVGNIIGYFLKKWSPKQRGAAAFGAGSTFVVHRLAELTLDGATPDLDGAPCTLVLGSDGFTARLRAPAEVGARHTELQFLVPAVAGPRFLQGTVFSVCSGPRVVGRGRIARVVADG